MSIDEFYSNLMTILPYKGKKNVHFRLRLKDALKQYLEWVRTLEIQGEPVNQETLDRIDKVCNKLHDIVKSSMQGLPSRAFSQLHNLLSDKDNKPLIDLRKTIMTIGSGKSFYRIRLMEEMVEAKRKELFHIPLDRRGVVKTQRFSIPGYPCLYLGQSIYGCWEEMRRPQMYKCAVSRFQNEEELNFIDLSIPKKKDLDNAPYLLLLPLVIASLVRVSDDNATYKPEYIVPQLIMEWILKNRTLRERGNNEQGKRIHGVAYTSTHLNDEFEFPKHCFINYAIPVFSVDPRNTYCRKLCDAFSLTLPTTNDIEKLKGNYEIKSDTTLTSENRSIINYNRSDFGNLETRLSNEVKFPLDKVGIKD